MEFLLEELSAAIRVAQIFGGISSSGDLQAHRASLERRGQAGDALAMRMIEGFRDPQNRGKTPGDTLVGAAQRGVGRVVPGGLGFAIVIADQCGGDSAM